MRIISTVDRGDCRYPVPDSIFVIVSRRNEDARPWPDVPSKSSV
jgi:hypothetical protein